MAESKKNSFPTCLPLINARRCEWVLHRVNSFVGMLPYNDSGDQTTTTSPSNDFPLNRIRWLTDLQTDRQPARRTYEKRERLCKQFSPTILRSSFVWNACQHFYRAGLDEHYTIFIVSPVTQKYVRVHVRRGGGGALCNYIWAQADGHLDVESYKL